MISIREATSADRPELADLIHFEVYVHRHLEWRQPLDWLGASPFLVAERYGHIIAALACAPDPQRIAWIRLFAASSLIPAQTIWDTLWPEAYAQLSKQTDLLWIAAIPLQRWFENLLEYSQFQQIHRVVMLAHEHSELPSRPNLPDITIRDMQISDLAEVEHIDTASFVPVWQNSYSALQLALKQAVLASVVERRGQIIGYQISTATPMGGHLARLAVHPDWQGQGIGYAVLHDLLTKFKQRGAATITVNTQQENIASLSLYQKFGFRPTDESYSVYQIAPRLKENPVRIEEEMTEAVP